MKKPIMNEKLINKITYLAPIRERAFFTIMRQSGLKPKAITRLRIRNLEQWKTIPRKIDVRPKLNEKKTKKLPHFIGQEANRYIKQYLGTRNDLTRESLLFATRNKENKEISTKNVSRKFSKILEKIEEEENKYRQSISKMESDKQNFSLKSLTDFYIAKSKDYRKELDKNPHENDQYYRKLYKEKALPFLEIESQISYKVITTRREYRRATKYFEKMDIENREMTQTIARNNEFISSILTLLYNNKGNPETRQNEIIGNNFIKLWKEVSDKQIKNVMDFWESRGKIKLLPHPDILEELTKTLKRIKKPHDELERQTVETRKNSENKVYRK